MITPRSPLRRRPLALDLFCGAGGAAMGLYRAGFDVVGIDCRKQPRYPFPFAQGDALRPPVRLQDFDLIWASPPCQFATQMSARWRGKGGKADSHKNLLTPTLAMLADHDGPWIVENVVGARKHMPGCFQLHGGMFALGVHRPRLFVSSFFVMLPRARATVDPIGIYGPRADGRRLFTRKSMNGTPSIQRAAHSAAEACVAMGIEHEMDWDGVREAIPPAYSAWIGRYALLALGREVA
jgi:DNA (cytosine-5)-methyltransferase 1